MTQLNISSLFTPAPSGVTANQSATPASGSWLAKIIAACQTIGLDTTSWQSGGAAKTILSLVANEFAYEDAIISIMAQGGFLDYAATGTVTYTTAGGVVVTQPVTPDPSIPSQNPTGALGWLDALCQSLFNTQRIAATYASNTLVIANTTSNSYGSYVAGTYHVENPTTAATYSNLASLTIASGVLASTNGTITGITISGSTATITTTTASGLSSGGFIYVAGVVGSMAANINGQFYAIVSVSTNTLTVSTTSLAGATISGSYSSGGTIYSCTTGTFVADVAGPTGSSAAGTITQTVTQNTGVYCINPSSLTGLAWESNTAFVARSRLKQQSNSPNGPSGAYKYFALTASQILGAQTPPISLLGGSITQALVTTSPVTGVVTTTIASASPASTTLNAAVTEGCSNLAITSATNATPIVITTASAHGLNNNDWVTITGVLGNTAANGSFQIAGKTSTTFQLVGSVGNGTYTSSTGFVDGGDLGQVDALIQAKCVPDNTTALTVSALAFPITITAAVVVPAAYKTTYTGVAQTQMSLYLASLPVGGNIPPGGSQGVLSYDDIIGVLFEAGSVNGQASYVRSISNVYVNSGQVDITFTNAAWQAVYSSLTLTVTGV